MWRQQNKKIMSKYLTEAEVGRKADRCPAAIRKAFVRHGIRPDVIASGRVRLYSIERLPEFLQLLGRQQSQSVETLKLTEVAR